MSYYKDPEKTREAFRGDYMTVGDMGYLDADGYLYIVDRKTDMVISARRQHLPAEIEEVLHEHPAVLDVAVIGVPERGVGRGAEGGRAAPARRGGDRRRPDRLLSRAASPTTSGRGRRLRRRGAENTGRRRSSRRSSG